ncbi:putative speedy protein E7 [Manis pentadactyla]|uniref:putative speedy protein E7 n=1 Tax=Manis pentadactyla TaxID=143292 RepID=UPI00255C5A96|nr:putative speedy protein E7 [Manis pentadactyla]
MAKWMGADGCQQRRRMERWLGRRPRSATAETLGAACLLGTVGVEWEGTRGPRDESQRQQLDAVAWFLCPAAQAHSSPPPEGSGRRRQRERSAALQEESEEAAMGEEDAWVLDMLCGLKMRLKRRRVSPVLPEHHEAFKRLLGDRVVKRFLAWDKNLRVSDKYLLAMVIAYFSRAGLPSWQYQRIHFFIALYLANDIEEDEGHKLAILWHLYGNDHSKSRLFRQQRVQFAQSMGWKAWVSREECEEIQAFDPELPVWKRDRSLLAV